MEVCPGGVQPLLCHRHMVCTYFSTFPKEAELVHVSAFEAQVVVSVICYCQSVRQLSHSAIIGRASFAAWIGRWLSLISWSAHCVMATAALKIVCCVLLRRTTPFLTCGLSAWETSRFVRGTPRTEQFSGMLYLANFTLT